MKMSDKSILVPQLQMKVDFTRVTRAFEDSLRPLRSHKVFDVVLNFLKGNGVFVSLPTGGGKSLCCAHLPLVYDHLQEVTSKSIALVISPLNTLLQDQVTSFSNHGMSAVHVDSDCSPTLVNLIFSGEVQLIC